MTPTNPKPRGMAELIRELEEVTRKVERIYKEQGLLADDEQPADEQEHTATNEDLFASHMDGLFGRSSRELTEEFVRDYPTSSTSTDTDTAGNGTTEGA